LTLWGKMGEEFDASSQPVVALKGVKLSDFGGRSLGTVSSTVVQVKSNVRLSISLLFYSAYF
jgi:replication factor A1